MEGKKAPGRRRILLLGGLAVLAAGLLYSVLARNGIWIPCLFRRITGFMCPGCGNTRAALSLLRLDFPAAVKANYMAIPEFFYIVWVLFHCSSSYLKGGRFAYKSPCQWLDISFLVLVLLWWILRNLIQ